MHGVLPARGAVLADIGLQLLVLAQRVAGERLVRLAGEERLAEGQEFAPGVVDVLDERGVQTLQDVRVGAQRERAEPLGGFSNRQNSAVGARKTPRRSVSLPSVASPKARDPITQE
jgi:hypothetical protein